MKHKSIIVAGWALMAWLVLCMLAATATAQDFQYKTNNGALTITAYIGAGGNVVVPGAIGGLPVGSIGSYGFSFSMNVTGVTLPNSITNIGEAAFYRCLALTNVTLGAGAITFGRLAFADCPNLNRITVDPLSSVYSSVDGVLFNKSRTTLIQYPTGKTGSYTIPNTVTTIGNSAFASCTGVTNIVIPNSVTGFGESAFSDCTNLTSVIMGDFITNIWYSAFYGCSRLTSVTISPSVQSIRSGAFAGCTSLTNVIIPYGVQSIWGNAFSDCTSLTSITIPAYLNSIGYGAFQNCSSLTEINVNPPNMSYGTYSSVDGVLFNKSQDTIVQYPQAKGGSYTIPNSVTWIQDYAFLDCTNLTGITMPAGLIHIGALAFGRCIRLPSITIPGNVNFIGVYAFNACANLNEITVDPLNSFYSSLDGVLFDLSQTTLIQYPGGKTGSYTIPNSVTDMGALAFGDCARLNSVMIPNSITSIGDYRFRNCTNLTSVAIPNSVTNIGYNAFSGCTRLTSVTIPNSVNRIGSLAFGDCGGLTNITIPSSVTSIDGLPFLGCTNLTGITVDALNPAFSSVDGVLFNKAQTTLLEYPGGKVGSYSIPNSVTNITTAFYGCTRLTSVTIPNSITAIGGYTFTDCSNLASVRIPNTVTNIEDAAFSGCSSLASVTIPDSVTSIGFAAFSDCVALNGIYFSGNALSLEVPVFAGADKGIVYYLPGSTGWGASFWGHPTALWQPLIQAGDARFGVGTNGFGFGVSWASGHAIVIEACTNLASQVWSPLQTNTLGSDPFYFSDPLGTSHLSRFYRLRAWPPP